jgi:hypothetical protein
MARRKKIELGTEVICYRLMTTIKARWQNAIFNTETCRHRAEGHIGVVTAFFPNTNCVHVAHQEYKNGEVREFITGYHLDEIKPFNPPTIIKETPLAKAIKLVQITRE